MLPLVAKLMLGVCVCVSVACSWLLSALARRGGAGMLPLVAKLMLGVCVCVCVCVCVRVYACLCMYVYVLVQARTIQGQV